MPRSHLTPAGALCAGLLAAGLLAGCTSSGDTGPSATVKAGPSVTAAPSSSPATATVTGPVPVANFAKVTGKATTLQFSPALVRALYTKGVSTVATGAARLVAVPGTSNAVLPITTGSAVFYKDPAQTALNLQHDTGGITLSSDSGSVRVTDLALHLGTSSSITGSVVITAHGKVQPVQTLQLFDLSKTSGFTAKVRGQKAAVSGLQLYVSATVGQIIDKALGTTAFAGGRVLAGTVTISIIDG